MAVEQGQKPMSIAVTAGQRGDSPQFEPVLAKVRVPRLGAGRPRVRPNRVRADKAYASARNAAPVAADRRSSTRRITRLSTRSSAASTASRDTGPWPRATTSSRFATRRPSSSRPSTSGFEPQIRTDPGPVGQNRLAAPANQMAGCGA
ncbi:hypothetical protein [Streptomyces sp. NPDC085540]|uniref:hypothetical protein n=1 Tax=Streptomyces sp. NPDC085540 TaxID=3365730 RepID=UPI0037D76585